jgi:organic hydroperoxide reductase OsmC/OhrA
VPKLSEFKSRIQWTGNRGTGTSAYRAYARTWDIEVPGKAVIHCSNDPDLGGDPSLMNPEDLLLSAVSGCHMLWYLHLASDNNICVLSYRDEPVGIGETARSGAGRFLSIQLNPAIVVTEASDLRAARALHEQVHDLCFIARSLSCSVHCKPTISTE